MIKRADIIIHGRVQKAGFRDFIDEIAFNLNLNGCGVDLKGQKWMSNYLAKAGPYKDIADPNTLLAERAEATISREHAKWVSVHE